MFQKFIAIKVPEGVKNRSAGTLTVGFPQKPKDKDMTESETVMKFYAQNPDYRLVKYLINTFMLGGPTFPK